MEFHFRYVSKIQFGHQVDVSNSHFLCDRVHVSNCVYLFVCSRMSVVGVSKLTKKQINFINKHVDLAGFELATLGMRGEVLTTRPLPPVMD